MLRRQCFYFSVFFNNDPPKQNRLLHWGDVVSYLYKMVCPMLHTIAPINVTGLCGHVHATVLSRLDIQYTGKHKGRQQFCLSILLAFKKQYGPQTPSHTGYRCILSFLSLEGKFYQKPRNPWCWQPSRWKGKSLHVDYKDVVHCRPRESLPCPSQLCVLRLLLIHVLPALQDVTPLWVDLQLRTINKE